MKGTVTRSNVCCLTKAARRSVDHALAFDLARSSCINAGQSIGRMIAETVAELQAEIALA